MTTFFTFVLSTRVSISGTTFLKILGVELYSENSFKFEHACEKGREISPLFLLVKLSINPYWLVSEKFLRSESDERFSEISMHLSSQRMEVVS